MDDFPSELNLHLWLGFSMAMLVITRWYLPKDLHLPNGFPPAAPCLFWSLELVPDVIQNDLPHLVIDRQTGIMEACATVKFHT